MTTTRTGTKRMYAGIGLAAVLSGLMIVNVYPRKRYLEAQADSFLGGLDRLVGTGVIGEELRLINQALTVNWIFIAISLAITVWGWHLRQKSSPTPSTTGAPGTVASILLAIASLVLLPAAMQAQGLGLKGGISYNNVTANGALPGNTGEQTGFTGGIGLVTGGLLGFGVEGLYAQRNAASSTSTGKVTFVDIPAYLRVRIPTPMLAPYAYAGPQWSKEIGCKIDGAVCPDDPNRRKTSTSAVIGGGIQLGKHGLSVEGRYVYGLSDLDFGTVSNTENYKSRTFVLMAGVGF